MNYTVHAVMYSYYFCTNIGLYHVVKHVAPLITFMQIAQMIFGMIILILVGYYVNTATRPVVGGPEGGRTFEEGYHPESCYVDPANLKMGLAMYFSYFVLFAMFFYDKYIGNPDKKETRHQKGKKD